VAFPSFRIANSKAVPIRPDVNEPIPHLLHRSDHASGIYPVARKYVQIRHDGDLITQYLHMSEVDGGIKIAERVERGQFLGLSGASSSMSIAPHLHLSVREGPVTRVDPALNISREIGGPRLDRMTAEEWVVSQFFLNGGNHGGTRSTAAPEFMELNGNKERWFIEFQRPTAERPAEAA
jgi:hypothetical protein